MDGLQVGAACFRSPIEAASVACSSVAGVSSAGVVSCSAPSISSGVLSYTLHVDNGTATLSRQISRELQPCEPLDWEYFEPVVAAWFLAMVVVLCTRLIYTKVFNRETA